MRTRYCLSFFIFIILSAVCLPTAHAATPQIATGFDHNVVLATDGTVWTWGSNVYGQLCDTTRPSPDALPKPIPGLTDVAYIAAGHYYTLAVKSNGSVWSCGKNDAGQLGRGFISEYERNLGQVVDESGTAYLNLDAGGTGVMAVAAGVNHSLVIRNNGEVWGWGSNYGKLGVDEVAGDTTRPLCGGAICTKPVQALAITDAEAIVGGEYHSMALDSGGQVWTWGTNNANDQLGRTGNEFVPAIIPGISEATAIAAGSKHSLAISKDGNLYGWGANDDPSYQQTTSLTYQILASDDFLSQWWPPDPVPHATQPSPVLIPTTSYALDTGNIIQYWNGSAYVDSIVPLLTNVVSVSASQTQSFIVTSNAGLNSVKSWGKNSQVFTEVVDADGNTLIRVSSDFRGILGLGHENDQTFSPYMADKSPKANYPPVAPLWEAGIIDIGGNTGISTIEAGFNYSLALRTDGTVYVSGLNNQYQLADDSIPEFISTPAPVRMLMTCLSGSDLDFNVNTPPTDCDFDGDGYPYATDNCPSLFNDQTDADSNGVGDVCEDPCLNAGGDTDNDGICNDNDNCPDLVNYQQNNADGDTLGDVCDPDADNDSVLNNDDNCPLSFGLGADQTDDDGDGYGNPCDDDIDGDSFSNAVDNCPDIANDQTNSDGDLLGDSCDTCPDDADNDIDDDGVCAGARFLDPKTDSDDNCPDDVNADQIDTDIDGLGNVCDNCPTQINALQENYDGDSDGDACDDDQDNDNVDNPADGWPLYEFQCTDDDSDGCDDCSSGIYDKQNDGSDGDFDGICDAGDNCPGIANPLQTDTDGDTFGDICDNDIDGDGVLNTVDNCPLDGSSADQTDTDSDGYGDICDEYPDDPYLVDLGISAIILPATDNKDGGNPKLFGQEFTFGVTVDAIAVNAASVWLVLNGQPIQMGCDFSAPAATQCTSSPLRLGPSPEHNYHYEVWDDIDQMLVSSLDIAGPDIYLLNGPNMIGLPKDMSASANGFLDNMGITGVFSWQSTGLRDGYNRGSFVARDNAHLPTPGEGYFVLGELTDQKLSLSLINDPDITDLSDPTATIALQPGWNIISNPYPAPILLADLLVQKNSDAAITWSEATTSNLLYNGIYYFKGADWGSQYAFERAEGNPEAELIPWLGYWLYLSVDDGATYKLIFSQP